MDGLVNRLVSRLELELADWQNNLRLGRMKRAIARHTPRTTRQRPVIFFRASTGLLRMSLNTAFPLLASWALGLVGFPVLHFVCQAGMSRCVQGTDKDDASALPPCKACIRHSRRLFGRDGKNSSTHRFTYAANDELAKELQRLDLAALQDFQFRGLPLGRLVTPSLQWVLRRYHLPDDPPTRFLLREYILSAYRVAEEFTALLDRTDPRLVVVFNGITFPEATARWVAQSRRIRVVTHEVGLREFSAFFTQGEATAYPIDIPPDFQLSSGQEARLEAYLEKRFSGQFTMAGIRFWPEMRVLGEDFTQKAARYRQVVPVFTNVVFDTSQVHASTVFPDMFAWLDLVLEIIRDHPETLFVIRAHPDEMRLHKESRESVRQWARQHKVEELDNVLFIDSQEYLSSYALIQHSKFVMVYNSSIGLEAALMGAAVLCGGKARYTQYPIVFFPQSPQGFLQKAEAFLAADTIDIPPEFQRNARRFLYYQLYLTSIPFQEYLEDHVRPGFVKLRAFPWSALAPKNSPSMRVIVDGLVHGRPFLLEEEPGD